MCPSPTLIYYCGRGALFSQLYTKKLLFRPIEASWKPVFTGPCIVGRLWWKQKILNPWVRIHSCNLALFFLTRWVTRHCADSVKLPNPARLVTVSEWRAPASQCRAAVSGETHPDTGNRPTAVSGYRRSVLQPTANCQASKARAWHTEGRWPRATPRRRVPSTSSAPLTLMEIRFWKVGQWGRRIAVGNICAQVSLEKYKGHVCIIVNVASKWGKTDVNYK